MITASYFEVFFGATILTRKDGILIQSIYWPFEWFSNHAAGRHSLTPTITSPMYKTGDRGEVPVLDASAVHDREAGTIAVFLTNRSTQQAMGVTVDIADARITAATGGDCLSGSDLKLSNTWERPAAIEPRLVDVAVADGVLRVVVPAPGFVCVRGTVQAK